MTTPVAEFPQKNYRKIPTSSGSAAREEEGMLPDFVIIGAQKCGTSSLYHLLRRHPYVKPARKKEIHYFDIHLDKGIDWYRSHFPSREWREGRNTIAGESSPYCLYHPHAPKRMAEVIPQARLLVLLRSPVDRAYSHYHHSMRKGVETLKFQEAIEAEETRLRGERNKILEDEHYVSLEHRHFSYLARGIYVDQLMYWSKFFDDDQILVLRSEDFFERPWEPLKRTLDFLGLPDWQPETWEVRNSGDYEESMDPATRRRLEEYFGPHNLRLYEHLGVDFGW